MLKYKRLSETNNTVRYAYYPDGDMSAEGIIEFKTGEAPKLIKPSPKEVKMYYTHHAFTGIDITKESGTVAWY